eukprot:5848381-Pyramimonas_sp.AAC.1
MRGLVAAFAHPLGQPVRDGGERVGVVGHPLAHPHAARAPGGGGGGGMVERRRRRAARLRAGGPRGPVRARRGRAR